MAVSTAQLQQLYLAYFGRPADFDGLVYYTTRTELSIWDVAASFSASPESQALYGAGFNASVINNIYINLFNRDAEPAGLLYWSQEVASGRLSPAGAALGILLGAQNDDLVSVNNKLAASAAFTEAMDTAAEIIGYSGNAAAANARAWLSTVTSDTASLEHAIANVDAAVTGVITPPPPPGQTFTLTINKDTITGAAGNDTIEVVPASATFGFNSTLNEFDVIDGGAGTDTMNIYVSGEDGANTAQVGTVKNVEIINIFNSDGDDFGSGEIDAAKFQGATQIWQHNGDSDLYNLSSSTVAGFRDEGYVSVSIDAASTATSVGIALENIGDEDGGEEGWFSVSGAALSTVNIAGSLVAGDDAYVGLSMTAGKNVQTVNVNSSVNVSLYVYEQWDSTKNVTTVNASGSTGSIEFSGDAATAQINTGSGNDYVYVSTATAKDDAATANDETISAGVVTGAGDDEIDVNTSGNGTTTIDAGAGDDSVFIINRGTGKLTVGLGAGDDMFDSDVAINGTDVIDGDTGTDGLLLSLVGASNVGAFRNFEIFDAVGMNTTLDVEILASNNTVTEIMSSGASTATLTNLGAGVGFRATGDAGNVTLTQKTAGAMTVTVDIDESEADAEDGVDTATVAATATNATSLTAVFDADFIDAVANTATLNLTGTKATSLTVQSGGAEVTNTLNYTFGTAATATAAADGLLTSVTVTGDQDLVLTLTSAVLVDAVGNESSVSAVNAGAFTGDFTFDLSALKNAGVLTIGSGVDVITVTSASTGAGMESIVGFEKAAATAIAATPSALAQADSDKLVLSGGTVLNAQTVAGTSISKGVVSFTGAGPTTLDAAIALVDQAAETAGEVAAFQYLNDTYVFVQGTTDTVVKLTGVTGVTTLLEVGTDAFILG